MNVLVRRGSNHIEITHKPSRRTLYLLTSVWPHWIGGHSYNPPLWRVVFVNRFVLIHTGPVMACHSGQHNGERYVEIRFRLFGRELAFDMRGH